jgi:D-methionine transport system substrate-binding protein
MRAIKVYFEPYYRYFFMYYIVLALIFTGCSKEKKLRVGVTAGPHAVVMEDLKKRADQKGLKIEIIEFNDFILPNAALDAKDLDANSYQHQPFLDEQVASRGYKIHAFGKTLLMPLGIYSKKIKNLKDLKDGAKVSIPNDPTNEGRALLLMQKMGLITLKDSKNPNLSDIKDNPKKLVIHEVDAPSVPRTLDDVDIALTNTDWIVLAKIDPSLALAKEDSNSPYTNVLVVRNGDEHNDNLKKLKDIYQSQETKDFVTKTFKGAIIAGF